MYKFLKQLPFYALVGSMALSACSVVAERPAGAGMGRDAERQERRSDDRYEDRRAERRDDRHEDRRSDRKGDRDDDKRKDRDHDKRDDRRDDRRGDARSGSSVQVNIGGYFGDRQRDSVYEYYGKPKGYGKCPPGLAKKGNGCQPPGQAKKWKLGQSLPRDMGYQPVEADIRVRLGVPPAGHEFVRVASDILLIAVGTSMVIDAIEDLQEVGR